ncbi:unnamed protein product [Citrullus colocynthis]|uniref:Uncharacterized protein n=1 Tax=Citrullus colocynthis TaxID=252529 RepID=A0ABP0YRH5_9ROSI
MCDSKARQGLAWIGSRLEVGHANPSARGFKPDRGRVSPKALPGHVGTLVAQHASISRGGAQSDSHSRTMGNRSNILSRLFVGIDSQGRALVLRHG